MTEYKEIESGLVLRLADGATIPPDPRNKDRQEYERWLEAGGVPEPYVAPEVLQPCPSAMVMSQYVTRDELTALSEQIAVLAELIKGRQATKPRTKR